MFGVFGWAVVSVVGVAAFVEDDAHHGELKLKGELIDPDAPVFKGLVEGSAIPPLPGSAAPAPGQPPAPPGTIQHPGG
jgi:hypothetical protein